MFIQFGHNDEVPTKNTYTPEAEFTANLKHFVAETRARQAQPVLLTPVARRKFDAAGIVEETHAAYAELVRAVAREIATPSSTSTAAVKHCSSSLGRRIPGCCATTWHPAKTLLIPTAARTTRTSTSWARASSA